MVTPDSFDVKFTSREVSAWGGLTLLKRMLDGMDFKSAMQSWGLPKPGSNRGYAPGQLIDRIYLGPSLSEIDGAAIRAAAKAHGLEDRIRVTSMLGTPRYT